MRAPVPGPEEIVQIADPAARLTGFIVIHSTRLGPAHGGVRIRSYATERDALLDAMDLAEAMTMKAALAGLPCGGGKIVLIDRAGLRRRRAMERLGEALNDLGGRYFAGPDYGATPADMARLRKVTRHVADGAAGRGGTLGDATARGTVAAIRAALRVMTGGRGELRGIRISVEGLGSVGLPIVRDLLRAGALVTAADPDRAAARRGASLGAHIVPAPSLRRAAAEVFVPAAVGGTIDERFARATRARIVCGPANNALASSRAESLLQARGVLFVPDILASAGALISGVTRRLSGARDPGPAIDRIGPRVTRLLKESARTGRSATETARDMAMRRIERGRRPKLR